MQYSSEFGHQANTHFKISLQNKFEQSVHFFSRNLLVYSLSQLMELECVCTCKCKVLVDLRNFTDRKRALILNNCNPMNLLVCKITSFVETSVLLSQTIYLFGSMQIDQIIFYFVMLEW